MTSPDDNPVPVALLLALSIAMAGCTSSPTDVAKAPPDPLLPSAAGLELRECSWHASTHDYPEGMGPGERPEGWSSMGGVADGIGFLFLECARLGVGSLERGPVSLVLEFYLKYWPPKSCHTAADSYMILNSIGVTDGLAIDELQSKFGMPAHKISAQQTFEEGPANSWSWSWSVSGIHGSESRLEFMREEETTESSASNYRFFWLMPEGRLGALDLSIRNEENTLIAGAATGSIGADHLHSNLSQWAGLAAILDSTQLRTSTTLYEDHSCEQQRSD